MEKISNSEIFYEVFVNNVLSLPMVRCLMLPTLLAIVTATFLEVKVSEAIRVLSKNISENKNCYEALTYYFYFVLAAAFFSEIVGFIFTGVVQYIYRTINRTTFKQFISISPAKFNHIGSGEVQAIIERKSKASSELFEVLILSIFPVLCTLAFVAHSVFSKLGLYPCLLIIISILIYAFTTITISIWRIKIRNRLNIAENKTTNKLQDSLINHETVYSYGMSEFEVKKYDDKLKVIESNAISLRRTLYLLNFSQKAIFLLQSTFIIFLGARFYLDDYMTPSDLVFFVSISRTLNGCLGTLGCMYSRFSQAMTNAKYTFGISKNIKSTSKLPCTTFKDRFSFINVNFSYDNKLIFQNLNFEIKNGEKVAIIGKNGVGKSTLIKLLLRFEKYEGKILLDGRDIQDLNEKSFRNTISYIPQTSFLFDESVAFNIKYGNQNVSDEEIYRLSKDLNCFKTFANLEKGFQTRIGERGKLLSGGEKQKILIMRALLNKKKIFVLDEPTSALDKDSELKVINSLLFKEETTVIMILQNLELISKFDKILLIENNKIETIENIGDLNDPQESKTN